MNKLAYHADGSVEWIHLREIIASYRRANPTWRALRDENGDTLPSVPADNQVTAAALMPSIRTSPPPRLAAIVEYVAPAGEEDDAANVSSVTRVDAKSESHHADMLTSSSSSSSFSSSSSSSSLPDVDVGYHVSIYWVLDKAWYNAVITSYDEKTA